MEQRQPRGNSHDEKPISNSESQLTNMRPCFQSSADTDDDDDDKSLSDMESDAFPPQPPEVLRSIASASASASTQRTFAPTHAHMLPVAAAAAASPQKRLRAPALQEGVGEMLERMDVQQGVRWISQNANFTESEKNALRQHLLSRGYERKSHEDAEQKVQMLREQAKQLSYSDFVDETTGKKMLGCEHYPRNCKIRAECCGAWVVCRLCHDAAGLGHDIDRFATREIMCMLCFTRQPVSNVCIEPSCRTQFASYFCDKCKFYDSTPGKEMYHCDKCGFCRIGAGIGVDNFHCERCDACVSLEYSEQHHCVKKSLDANCPICGLYLHTSTKPVVFMKCGHTMHADCFDEYTAEYYTCPLCHKTLTNMKPYWRQLDDALERERMPEQHQGKVSEVLCYDCDERSVTPYHFLYHKCMASGCGSYNTCVIRTFRPGAGASSDAV